MKLSTLALAALTLLAAPAFAQTVRVKGGLVAPAATADGVAVYKAIPFAAPPVGDLRWRAPAPATSWKGVRRKMSFAPLCMQKSGSNAALGLRDWAMSEDCLYLNVWTPATRASQPLAVMVWIHGGSFASGGTAIPAYDGADLARKGVVVVSIAYRLGAFGFLASPELSRESGGHGSGDYGLEDQIAALKWVKRNIGVFGGDPGRVTVFGESAGAISVSMLAASPLAKGLFARAIAESGASFAPLRWDDDGGAAVLPLGVAEAHGTAFLKELGVSGIAAARRLPAKVVENAKGSFWPVADGAVILGDQWPLYESGRYNDTPILIGTDGDEGALFVHKATAAELKTTVEKGYGPWAAAILAAYPASDDRAAVRASRDLFRDVWFGWPAWAWARLQAQTGHGAVYKYQFDHAPPWPPFAYFAGWGASHGSEIGYVFNNLRQGRFIQWKPQDFALADQMSSYWVNFAKTGDPNGPGLPPWPRYTTAAPLEMRLDIRSEPQPVANMEKLKVLDGYFAWRRTQDAKQHGPDALSPDRPK